MQHFTFYTLLLYIYHRRVVLEEFHKAVKPEDEAGLVNAHVCIVTTCTIFAVPAMLDELVKSDMPMGI